MHLGVLLILAASCELAVTEETRVAAEDGGEELAAMQTVMRLREAACTAPLSAESGVSAGLPKGSAVLDSEEMAMMQTARRVRAEVPSRAAAPLRAGIAKEEVGGTASHGRYMPSVHAKAVREAFNSVLAQGGAIREVLDIYTQAGMFKKTHGTCEVYACDASRGMTDCLGDECMCQDGYGTIDGSTCVTRYASPLLGPTNMDTGGTCSWFSCSSWRGPTYCHHGKCLCQDGYIAEDGKCVAANHADPAKDIVETMMLAGVREPDELACPGDTFEEGTMNNALLKMALGEEHFNVSLCRTGAQVYHASPLPMVVRHELHDPPVENGYQGDDNALKHLYSVMTMRQWRSHVVKIIATEFVYAITMPDLGEGAKRLGNAFHTLSDSFSASHVERAHSGQDGGATAESCAKLAVELPMSMDVMNFVIHPIADLQDHDILFECSRYYEEGAIRIWAEARRSPPASLSAANAWVDRIVQEVFCAALPIPADILDHPAGGASVKYSVDLDQPALPRGTASESDANRIIAGWACGLAAERAKEHADARRPYPQGLVVPARSEDVCQNTHLAHVGLPHFEAARNNNLPPQYLQPYF